MHELLSTEERIKVLQYVLERSLIGVEEVANATGLSKGLVSKTLSLLVKYGITKKEGRKFKILETPQKRELKRFLNFVTLYPKLKALKEDWIISLGVYGSFARGENRPESDLDVWVFTKKPGISRSAKLKRAIELAVGREVNLLLLTSNRLNALRENDPVFYYSLVYGSLIIWGEPLDRISSLRGEGTAQKGSAVKGERTAEH
ncbi:MULTISPECIES: nucleotidyltransferase domain-containing protein [Thermococcus]|uniref:protein adenylyltransferase n=1 Tax=Thermococcus waiotapuensis TaxID=90909 RepID=A0AAE4NS57_9EURY|nr:MULTISPECIES: nucleotidyltransferase domain-containing protein [Thermococcus]MDV3103348.1 nucleotidyltransferase domain-containing protein [Thermococcus waiotapuensis]